MSTLHPATFAFLDAIAEYNTREYFASVKDLYQEILTSVTELCQHLIDETGIRHADGGHLNPKDCLFRIYRDARRLQEGDPLYKHNFGFVISPTGKKSAIAGYYVHIEPGNSFFACGMYWPSSIELRNLRKHLAEEGIAYLTHTHHPDFVERFGQVQGEMLTGMPRGFQDYDHHINLLKMKQHLVYHPYTDEEVLSDTFAEQILIDIQTAQPRADRLTHAATHPLQ